MRAASYDRAHNREQNSDEQRRAEQTGQDHIHRVEAAHVLVDAVAWDRDRISLH